MVVWPQVEEASHSPRTNYGELKAGGPINVTGLA
jgi:hypothetical protein